MGPQRPHLPSCRNLANYTPTFLPDEPQRRRQGMEPECAGRRWQPARWCVVSNV